MASAEGAAQAARAWIPAAAGGAALLVQRWSSPQTLTPEQLAQLRTLLSALLAREAHTREGKHFQGFRSAMIAGKENEQPGGGAEAEETEQAPPVLAGQAKRVERLYRQALVEAKAAVALDPTSPRARLRLAAAQSSLGAHTNAVKTLAAGLSLDPHDPALAQRFVHGLSWVRQARFYRNELHDQHPEYLRRAEAAKIAEERKSTGPRQLQCAGLPLSPARPAQSSCAAAWDCRCVCTCVRRVLYVNLHC
jgi:hypothetical protein